MADDRGVLCQKVTQYVQHHYTQRRHGAQGVDFLNPFTAVPHALIPFTDKSEQVAAGRKENSTVANQIMAVVPKENRPCDHTASFT